MIGRQLLPAGVRGKYFKREFVMKRFWHTWLTMVAVATMVSTASAQSGSRSAPEIGSYQSILSRSGYGGVSSGAGFAQQAQGYAQQAQGYAQQAQGYVQQAPTYGCASGNCGGGVGVAQPGNGFSYQGGVPAQSYAPPVQSYSSGPGQTLAGPIVPSSSDPVISSVDVPYTNSVPSYSAPSYSAPSYSAPVYSAPSYSAPSYSAPAIYSPGSAIGGVGAIAGRATGGGGRNLVASVSALAFVRDYEDTRLIARNPAGDLLFTNQADHDTIGGVDFALASRKSNGNGWEARYFGLFPDTDSATLTGAQVSAVGLRGLDRVSFGGASVDTFFADGDSQTVTRDTDIHNLEFNLLRNGGRFCTRRGRQGNFELLGGFRYFQFDEEFTYSTADGATPIDYRLNADNTLLGLQLGSRAEICLGKRLRLAGGFKTGIFNNNANSRQQITDPTGSIFATVPTQANRNFDYSDEQNDVAILSELDLGVILQFSQRARLRVGYRAIGVSGVALATDQIPFEFDNVLATERANTNGSLQLHGGYFGTEFCF